jgi:ribosomal protein S19E (S16A)
MDDKAFFMLEAINRGGWCEIEDYAEWLNALKTIRWIAETADGPVLTAEGRQALDDMSTNRRHRQTSGHA